MLARLDDGGIHEAFTLALAGGVEHGLPAIAHDEIAPVEMDRPFFTATTGNRNDARCLDFLDGGAEIVPGLDVFRLHARLGKQLLVIKETDEADLVGHCPDLAVKGEAVDCRGVIGLPQLAAIGVENLAQILECAGF